jgi:3,4-dihydroxy-2-butanone 4-phosphate synthase
MELNSIEEIIEDIRQGKMVVIMDDEDRENEGDLLMAASLVRPQAAGISADLLRRCGFMGSAD